MSHAIFRHHSPLRWLELCFENLLATSDLAPDTQTPASRNKEDFADELVERLENGYVAEDTGRFVTVPDFITRQIKARLETNDWC